MSDTLLTPTKIRLPRRLAGLLTRQRLFDLLDDLLDYRLIIVTAPAGYGKTSLLIDLAHQLEVPVCWYSLDVLDQDPQRFITHLIASIAGRFPDFGRRSTAALQSMTSADSDLSSLVRIIVNEAYEHIREHFLLVLDDYHLVAPSERINRFINQFVQEIDENCHTVLSSRTLLTLLDLPSMVARSQVGGLGYEELAFRADEIQALALQNYQQTMPEAAAEELARETEGWITGLLLSAQTMWQGMADRVRVARVSGVGLYGYLAQQVLDQQPAPLRSFLLRTSLLEEFDAELCEAVLGHGQDWQSLIRDVLQRNLFAVLVENEGTWLRYHHLFQDFLQSRLAEERPEERERLLRRLVAVYAEREEWDKAHSACLRLGDVVATAELIEQAGSPLVKSGRLATLAEWIDSLPEETAVSRPALLSLRGDAAAMLGQVARGLSLLDQAEAAFRADGDLPRLARTLVRRATAHRFLGDYPASLADADEALALAEADECLHPVKAEALRTRGNNLGQMGRLNEATTCLEQSLADYRALGDAQNVAMVLLGLGLAYIDCGRYDQALAHYTRALDYWRREDNVTQQANLLNNLGVLSHLAGDYERAGSLLEEALARARESGYTRIEAYALCSIGDLCAELDAHDAARDAYGQAREIARHTEDRFLLFYVDLAEAALARSDGNLSQAHGLLDSARQLAEKGCSASEQVRWQVEAGRLALAERDGPKAVVLQQEAVDQLDDGGKRVEGARAHLYLAVAHHSTGDQQAALGHLGDAFSLMSQLESQHALVVAGREAKALLGSAQGNPALGRQASRLLRQVIEFEHDVPILRRQLRQQTSAVPLGPPRLTIQAFGQAQVALNGQPVEAPEWHGRKTVRDLFFLLLAHPDGLTKEEVGAVFWPDSSPGQLKLRFKNAIYRLRRALGQEVVLFQENRYRFNRALDYAYDVEHFLGKLAQAKAAIDPAERVPAYREVTGLYTGPYLPKMNGTWVWPERERLRRAWVEATLSLAQLHLESGEYDATLACCGRVLAQDPCLEAAHCLAMRAYAAMGDRAAVVRQFEQCRQALLEDVDASPSPQTKALYETLVR